MDLERRRSLRVAVTEDGTNGLVRGAVPVDVRDISSGGLRLGLPSSLDPGSVFPFTALLRGLCLATPVRITRCGPGAPAEGMPDGVDGAAAWEAGAEFLWRDEGDAVALRRWLERKADGTS